MSILRIYRQLGLSLLFLFVAAVAGPSPASAQAVRPVIVGWEEGLKPPYLMLDAGGHPVGIAVDLLDEIFRRAGVRAMNVVEPWVRCLEDVASGAISVVPNASYNADRVAYALFTDPLYETHLVLYYSAEKFPTAPVVEDLDGLSKYTVLGILGFNYSRYQGKVRMETAAKDRVALVRMLKAGRGDFAAEQDEIMQDMANKGLLDLQGLGKIPDPAQSTQPFYILVSKQAVRAANLVSVIDSGIAALKKDGTYDAIVRRYLDKPGP